MDRLTPFISTPMSAATAIAGEISSFINNSLTSIPTNCWIPFPADPGFTERAARYSSFSYYDNYREAQAGILQTGNLSRISSSQSLKSKEISSVTELGSRPGESNARKRKAALKSKEEVAEESNSNVKKSRPADSGDEKAGFHLKEEHNGEEKQGKDDDGSELPEPPKGYIHVRARRGQATDSHSLAERVRREKISQRMKVLQDLVPGCNKITGKALMLDEIINYVQSLQLQVELLSMKLATLNPQLDCNLVNLVSMSQSNTSVPSSAYPTFTNQSNEGNPLHFGVAKGMETHSSLSQVNYTISGAAASQLGNRRDDDLRSIVQMSPVQNQEAGFSSQIFNGIFHEV